MRQLGALLLLALLCCPIALSGHTHPAGDLSGGQATCTVCAATAHAPALSPPALPQFVLLEQGDTTLRLLQAPPSVAERCTRGPRAPPAASSTLVA